MTTKPTGEPPFLPGIELSRALFVEVVQPLLAEYLPDLPYAAALMGPGSEVLGFDDPMSTDHHWGPRMQIFLHEADLDDNGQQLDDLLRQELTYTFRGYSVNFSEPNPEDRGTQALVAIDSGEVNHRIEIDSPHRYARRYLGIDPAEEIEIADWLSLPQQILATFTGGMVFHDRIGLEALRGRFSWYPRDVWIYLMAGSWDRIGEDEHLMGRAGLVGDEIGSALLASRIVRELMHLAFLRERRYAPYPKWFGTAFATLKSASSMTPYIQKTLSATDWRSREEGLVPLYEHAAREQNRLKIGGSVREEVQLFFTRPFRIIGGERISEALLAAIEDPQMRALTQQRIIGGVDTWTINTSLLCDRNRRAVLRSMYQTS